MNDDIYIKSLNPVILLEMLDTIGWYQHCNEIAEMNGFYFFNDTIFKHALIITYI